MTSFEDWNRKLLAEYFSPRLAGEEVFVDATPEKIDELGAELGGNRAFLAAVRRGPSWTVPIDFVGRVKTLVLQRSDRRRRPPGYVDPGSLDPAYRAPDTSQSAPAYLPYVAALARAASSDAYYKQLRTDLDLPENWHSAEMRQILPMWEDLESWTKSTNARFGRFKRRVVGSHCLVGLPRSQVLLSARDVEPLHELFELHGLQPGVQPTEREWTDLIADIATREGTLQLSKPLRDAAENSSEFGPLLRVRLFSVLEDWDGFNSSGPEATSCAGQSAGGPSRALGARMGLSLSPGGALPWRMRIAAPGLGTGDVATGVAIGNSVWALATQVLGSPATAPSDDLASVLMTPLGGPVSLVEENAPGQWIPTGQSLVLERKPLRVMVGRTDARYGWEIWEDVLPAAGGAYLLASPEVASELASYLEREAPRYLDAPTQGLPPGWRLVFLEQQNLEGTKRNLPGIRERHALTRPIRFEGGLALRDRGYREFLPYDLPTVVLDAPPGFQLRCVGAALELSEEEAPPEAAAHEIPLATSIRRYRLNGDLTQGGVFQLRARNDMGTELHPAVLRVRASSSTVPSLAEDVWLDNTGSLRAGGVGGLRGACLAGPTRESDTALPQAFALSTDDLGGTLDPAADLRGAAACFLDALAQRKSIAYGRARDLVDRLLGSSEEPGTPAGMIASLWARGYLEVERTARGQLARVFAIPPAAYLLPLKVDGAHAWGVGGTVTLAQWDELADGGIAWTTHCDQAPYLKAIRLTSHWSTAAIGPRLQSIGMQLLPFQGASIARWAAGPVRMRNHMAANCGESPITAPRDLRVYDPTSGEFRACHGELRRPDVQGPDIKLYRMRDPRTHANWVHMVATNDGFAFVQDLQWAKWLALDAFCRFVGICDSSSPEGGIPLEHDESTGDLWLPEPLRLPLILERAAVGCAGAPAELTVLKSRLDEHDGTLSLVAPLSGQVIRRGLPRVYERFTNARWLRYRFVPAPVRNLMLR